MRQRRQSPVTKTVERLLKTTVFGSGIAVLLAVQLPGLAVACERTNNCDDLAIILGADSAGSGIDRETAAGISISVDGETVVGMASIEDANRRTDVDLEAVDIQVKFDGLGVERSLSVSTIEERRVHAPGEPIGFRGYWNYPDWISRAEVRIYSAREGGRAPAFAIPLETVPLALDQTGNWLPPEGYKGDYLYAVRVYDASGRFDESDPLPIVISENADALPKPALFGQGDGRGIIEERPAAAYPGRDRNQLAVANIPLHGGAVTVYGRNIPEGLKIRVQDRDVPLARENDFVEQTILPPGEHVVEVVVEDEATGRVLEFERDINIPDNEWFYVGIADVTLGRRTGRDSHLLAPVQPGEYEDTYQKGRVAFYLKGKVKGRYLITAALDTREEDLDQLFSNMDKKDPRHLLRRLDPDDYYPVYGDDSVLKEDAPTSGKFYIRVDRGRSHVMWGNFKTRIDGIELARFERGLYGAQANLATENTTHFGEPVASIEAFAAQPGTLPQRDEFLGSGGSVYFLQRRDINQGSEQVTIEIRDDTTGLVVGRKTLREGEDYTIDYIQGVIILAKPLQSTVTLANAVLGSGLADYRQFLVVNYEYTPAAGEVEGYSYGGRAEGWLFDTVRLGVTGFSDNTGPADQTLVGADATWRLAEKSYFQLEWAQSEGDAFASVISSDGGIIFKPVTAKGVSGTAEAWRARMLLDLGELTHGSLKGSIGAGYEEREAGFNGPGRYSQSDETIIDAHADIELNERMSVLARFDQVDRSDGVSKLEASAELKVRVVEDVIVQVGATHSDTESQTALSDGVGERTDVGARITYEGFGEDKYYVFGQKTVSHDSTRERNDRVGAGFEADISDKLRASGELSYGTSGIGLLAGLSYEPTATDKYHVGYRMIPDTAGGDLLSYDPFARDNGSIVIGARRQMSETVTAWTEHNFDMMGTSQGMIQAYGVEYTPDPVWKIVAGMETGTVEDLDGDRIERIAPSLAITWQEDGRKVHGKLETRFEDSNVNGERVTWLGQASASLQYNDNWRFLSKIDAAISDGDDASVGDADYIEASIGWAYRPVDNDRLNALFKYTYLHDLPAPNQLDEDNVVSGPKQRSHILSADFIYDLNERMSVGGKYGMRTGEVSISGDDDFIKSTAHLAIARVDFHVVKNWDVLLEGRALWLDQLGQVEWGALAGIYRHIGNNLKVGVGYNFGRFSDDLTDLTLDDEGVFVNVIGKF